MKNYSVVMPGHIHQALAEALLRHDGNEDLCFATYVPSTGAKRSSGILTTIITPEPGEREVHGNVSFFAQYLERATRTAAQRKEGIAFLHSHLGPGWQAMSDDDVRAEERIALAAHGTTNLPLLGLTLGTDGAWSARFWTKDPTVRRTYRRHWCTSVRVVDSGLTITYHDGLVPARLNRDRQLRTISAWGPKAQVDLSRLTVGIVGLGSVGSIVAEILARTGFSRFVLIDFDAVEAKNLDRLTNIFDSDIGRAKVLAVSDAIRKSSSAVSVEINSSEYSICEKAGFEAALDCDVLFSCVDRPWPRQILNFIAYAHLIPVIDGGILVRTNDDNTRLLGADWKSQVVGYRRTCLECLGQYTAADAAAEKAGYFDDLDYIRGLPPGSSPDVHENVFAFSSSLAASEVLQLLSLVLQPGGIADVGQQMFHFVTGRLDVEHPAGCQEHCFLPTVLGKGDYTGVTLFDSHPAAFAAREQRMTVPASEADLPQARSCWKQWMMQIWAVFRG